MKESNTQNKSGIQKLNTPKGRAMLQWYEKSAPKSIEWFPAQEKEVYGNPKATDWNKIFWGDNKQVLAHLLKEYRGKVDLIYIDPPFDSKADYVKKIKLKGRQIIEGVEQNVIEQMQYTDMWEKDEYLQFMYERLILMRELLSENGVLVLHCDWHKNSHLRLVINEVFGEDNFINEIIRQKKYWISIGIKEEEIVCFYLIPHKENYDKNPQFFLKKAEEISKCEIATVANFRSSLLARQLSNEYLYIYIALHGGNLYRILKAKSTSEADKKK